MSDNLRAKMLELYRTITEESEATLEDALKHFRSIEIHEPMIHDTELHGKISTDSFVSLRDLVSTYVTNYADG